MWGKFSSVFKKNQFSSNSSLKEIGLRECMEKGTFKMENKTFHDMFSEILTKPPPHSKAEPTVGNIFRNINYLES